MHFMSDPQALHVTRNVIPGKLGVDLHLHRVHIPLVLSAITRTPAVLYAKQTAQPRTAVEVDLCTDVKLETTQRHCTSVLSRGTPFGNPA